MELELTAILALGYPLKLSTAGERKKLKDLVVG